ncbi:hypothetical protein [Nocardia otitidiscaviarum]|uniref:hypothetical protein n=1 Tax=Nocardia otitidiscaviarum TaxID=1823 RepID=UPI0004A6C2A6|nr:hypothetical protein [Nocardia otitidiscaviarum]
MADNDFRAQLNALLSEHINYRDHEHETAVDALLAAGVRPPVRVISDPAELDALPIESVVIDADGDAWQRYFTYWWLAGADTKRDSQGLVELCKRLTVVHIPPTSKEATDGQ